MRKVVYVLAGVLVIVALSHAHATTIRAGEEERMVALVHSSTGEEQASALHELALFREFIGKLGEAIATWGYLKKTHGTETVPNDTSAPDQTYARQADFHITRLRHLQNLQADPPKPPSEDDRRTMHQAIRSVNYSLPFGSAGYVHMSVPVDMDGDLVPEIFTVVGRREELGKRAEMILLVHKLDRTAYQEVFRWSSPDFHLGWPDQPNFGIADSKENGMYEIGVAFEPETDNVATLMSNGKEITWQ